MTTSSTRARHEGTSASHPPADQQATRRVYHSILRLQKAETAQRKLNHFEHGLKLDDLFESISRMSHRARLDRLAELGKRTDDLRFPEPQR